MVRRKKRQSADDKSEVDLGRAIAMAVRSGKTTLGSKNALHESRAGKAKAFVVASNAPEDIVNELKYNLKITQSENKFIQFDKSSIILGQAIGRPHHVSILTIYDEGDSKILDIASSS